MLCPSLAVGTSVWDEDDVAESWGAGGLMEGVAGVVTRDVLPGLSNDVAPEPALRTCDLRPAWRDGVPSEQDVPPRLREDFGDVEVSGGPVDLGPSAASCMLLVLRRDLDRFTEVLASCDLRLPRTRRRHLFNNQPRVPHAKSCASEATPIMQLRPSLQAFARVKFGKGWLLWGRKIIAVLDVPPVSHRRFALHASPHGDSRQLIGHCLFKS